MKTLVVTLLFLSQNSKADIYLHMPKSSNDNYHYNTAQGNSSKLQSTLTKSKRRLENTEAIAFLDSTCKTKDSLLRIQCESYDSCHVVQKDQCS